MDWLIIIITMLICAQLWRMGGDGMVWARAFVYPLLIALVKFALVGYWTHPINWLALGYMPALWALMSLFSYGLSAPPHKFWVWVFGKGDDGNYRPVEIITRATCGMFWAVAALTFAFVTHRWWAFGLYVPFLSIANGLIGGTVEDVELSERLVGLAVAFALLV